MSRIIHLVDEDFTHRRGWFQAYAPMVAALFFVAISNYVWLTYVRTNYPADTVLLAVTLVIIADSYVFSLLLTMEDSARLRRIFATGHFLRLKKTGAEPILLIALIRMRANLPKGVTLKTLRDYDPSLFSKEKLTLRSIEPLP